MEFQHPGILNSCFYPCAFHQSSPGCPAKHERKTQVKGILLKCDTNLSFLSFFKRSMVPVHFQTDHCQLATCTPSSLYALSQQKRLLNMTGYNHSMHHVLNKFASSYIIVGFVIDLKKWTTQSVASPFPPLQWIAMTLHESAAIHSLTLAVYLSMSLKTT